MLRCYIDSGQWPENTEQLSLSGDESCHLVKSLRAKPGDTVVVFNGCGRSCPAKISSISARMVKLDLSLNDLTFNPPPKLGITLIQAIAKPRAMDMIFQKGTELGVSAIAPVATARSVAGSGKDVFAKRTERWKKITINAAKQCGMDHLPKILQAKDLSAALDNIGKQDLLVFGSLGKEAIPFKKIETMFRDKAIGTAAMVIGPEGDLTEDEHGIILKHGGLPVNLGPRVLRVETAAICALVLTGYIFSK